MITKAVNKSKINAMAFKTAERSKGKYFSAYEWEVFTKEIESGKNIKVALHNARYYGKLNKNIRQLEEGRGTIHELIEVEDD